MNLTIALALIENFYNNQVARIEAAFELDMHAHKGDEAAIQAYHDAMTLARNLRIAKTERACAL